MEVPNCAGFRQIDAGAAITRHLLARGRRRTAFGGAVHPAPATIGNALLVRIAPAMHWAFYLLVLLMAGSGVAMSVLAGLPGIVFGGVGTLPMNFDALPPRAVHGVVAKLLMLVIGLHIAAALYHQFIRRDGLLSRMGFWQR